MESYLILEAYLHIARTRSFSPGCGNMFTDVACRNDDLGLADIVILQEDDLEKIANLLISIDDLADLVDEMDDGLRHPVPWRRLATKDTYARLGFLTLLWRHLLQLQIPVDDAEDVELLSLVLVHTLHLNIEQTSRIDRDIMGFFDILGEAHLVGVLDLLEFFPEVLVIHKILELVEQSEVSKELVSTELASNQFRETWIGLVQPSPRGDAVGDICEFVWTVDLDKVFENGRLDEVGVKLSDTVDLVTADNSQVGHANPLRLLSPQRWKH